MWKLTPSSNKAFTLVELLIVIVIVSITYYFAISTIKFSTKKTVDIDNIKSMLLKYNFNDTISLKCIEDGKKCYIVVDGKISSDTIDNLFKTKPIVYYYDTNFKQKEFDDLELNDLDSYEVCFEYNINRYRKSEDMIVEANDKVYIFNSIYDKPIVVNYLDDVSEYFSSIKDEVKDAF